MTAGRAERPGRRRWGGSGAAVMVGRSGAGRDGGQERRAVTVGRSGAVVNGAGGERP